MYVVIRKTVSPQPKHLAGPLFGAREASTGSLNPKDTFKISVPTPVGRVYLRLAVGRERRLPDRIELESQASAEKISIVYTLLLWNFVGLVVLGAMVSVYLVKSFLGINLFPADSFLHSFLFSAR